MRVRRNPVELCVSRQVGLVRSLSGKETRPATKMSSRTSTVETKVSRIRHEDVQSNTEMSGALLLRHSDELADAPNQRWQVAAVQRGPPRRCGLSLSEPAPSSPFLVAKQDLVEDRQLKQKSGVFTTQDLARFCQQRSHSRVAAVQLQLKIDS